MPVTSKTGLLPSVNTKIKDNFQKGIHLEMPNLAVPATFALRPFTGICNPFPSSCSILCNHPTNFEARTILKNAKNAWLAEGKSIIDLDEITAFKRNEKLIRRINDLPSREDRNLDVTGELFQKYAETDSRPITPAPTLASSITKTIQSLKARRCVTPDPTSFTPVKEKTLLVLDLRRSHSQDIFCYQGGQSLDSIADDVAQQDCGILRTPSPNTTRNKKKKDCPKTKQTNSAGRPTSLKSLKSEISKDSDTKSQTPQVTSNRSSSKGSLIQEQEIANNEAPQISSESSSTEMDYVKRRGKKRKGKKTGKDGTKEGEKEFKGIPDPGETQVSALESDSREGSSKGSVTGEEEMLDSQQKGIFPLSAESKRDIVANESFLKSEILKQLQRQLDQEVVESELDTKRKIALQEALKCKVKLKQCQQEEEMKNLKKEFQLQIKNSEKWLSIPRVFTRRSARFELPMDSRQLNDMTPMQYVQKYVFSSPERLVLYNHVFNLYKEEPEDDEGGERLLLGKNVVAGLGNVMGRQLTKEEAEEFQKLVDWKDEDSLDFRTFTGISATCERLMASKFSSRILTQEEDPRHAVERADFETLEGKLLRLKPDLRLVKILKSARDL